MSYTNAAQKRGKTIGIDLGMTNAYAAFLKGDQPVMIASTEGGRATPAVVGYCSDGDRFIGQRAKHQAIMNPESTFYAVNRFIGRKYDEVTDAAGKVFYQVLPDSNGKVKFHCPNANQDFTPEEITAQLLRKLVDDATTYLGEEITQVVITVPCHFNDSQRQAVKDAGTLAGLEVLRLISKPYAAALAYRFDRRENEIILVFDFGGNTLDVTVLEVGDGVFDVLATSRDPYLGGNDFDNRIIDWIANQFQRLEGIDLRQDRHALQRLTEEAERIKSLLSSATQAEVHLPFIAYHLGIPKHLDLTLTRAEFEAMCSDLLVRCRIPIEQALKEAKLPMSEVNEVILVGGSTYIPCVQELVRQMVGKQPCQDINPQQAVALGTSILAASAYITNSLPGCPCLTPIAVGFETADGLMTTIIPRCSWMPIQNSVIVSTAVDGQTSVEIHVLRGERILAENNYRLTTVRLDGISPAPKGVPRIEVTFEIDVSECLFVSVKDLATGKTQSTTTSALNLSCDELEDNLRDANAHYETDYKLREQVENTQKAAALVRETEKQLRHLLEQEIADRSLMVGIVEHLQGAIATQDSLRDQFLTNTSLPVLVEMGKPIFYTKAEFSQLKTKEEKIIDADFDPIDGGCDVTDADFDAL
jgi:molecular chaperone DnaK